MSSHKQRHEKLRERLKKRGIEPAQTRNVLSSATAISNPVFSSTLNIQVRPEIFKRIRSRLLDLLGSRLIVPLDVSSLTRKLVRAERLERSTEALAAAQMYRDSSRSAQLEILSDHSSGRGVETARPLSQNPSSLPDSFLQHPTSTTGATILLTGDPSIPLLPVVEHLLQEFATKNLLQLKTINRLSTSGSSETVEAPNKADKIDESSNHRGLGLVITEVNREKVHQLSYSDEKAAPQQKKRKKVPTDIEISLLELMGDIDQDLDSKEGSESELEKEKEKEKEKQMESGMEISRSNPFEKKKKIPPLKKTSKSDRQNREKQEKQIDEPPPRDREGESEPHDDAKKGLLSFILATKSVTERKTERVGKEIESLIKHPTAKDRQVTSRFQSAGGSSVKEYCRHGTKENCRANRRSHTVCENVHFRAVIHPHTDKKLGDCSYLNACRHMKTCKFVHYEIDYDERRPRPRGRDGDEDEKTRQRMEEEDAAAIKKFLPASKQAIHFWPEMYNFPPQWICCDVRGFNLEVLGEFPIIMADPPWDIHMELPYGTLKDEEMLDLPIDKLAKAGVIFLWVTGRAMELGRKCLQRWGYDCVGEMLWVKTNQLQRLIRTGRTGHWLNHSKEHCLIGLKGDPPINHNIDCDVIVSEVRETSRKPDEIYGLLERLAPGARKLEIFGRQHNTRPGWVTLGNQLDGTALADPFIIEKWKALYPKEEFKLIPVAHLNQNSTTSLLPTETLTSDSVVSSTSSSTTTSASPKMHSTQTGSAPSISSL